MYRPGLYVLLLRLSVLPYCESSLFFKSTCVFFNKMLCNSLLWLFCLFRTQSKAGYAHWFSAYTHYLPPPTPQQPRVGFIVDSAPRLGVYYFFVVDSVCLYICLSRCSFKLHLLCFSMESSHFLAVSSPRGIVQNCFFYF